MSSKINLDKTCAEFGMGLLKDFSELETLIVKDVVDHLTDLENVVDRFKFESNESNFDKSKKDAYKTKLENKLNEYIQSVFQNSSLSMVKKYLIVTWGLYSLKNDLIEKFDFSKIKGIEKEKERVKKLIDNLKIKFEFSASSFETEITKALGILVEDGPFAYMIWLKSQDKEPHRAILIQTARILNGLKLIEEIKTNENLKEKLEEKFLNDISVELTKTLFVKTILEKMLIYARYKAKAMQHE